MTTLTSPAPLSTPALTRLKMNVVSPKPISPNGAGSASKGALLSATSQNSSPLQGNSSSPSEDESPTHPRAGDRDATMVKYRLLFRTWPSFRDAVRVLSPPFTSPSLVHQHYHVAILHQ